MTTARILLVEDEGLIRLITAEFLQDEGFDVVEAVSGDQAAQLLAGPGSFDILFTDVQMPGELDGVDLALQARRKHPAIPVLIVSGYSVQLTKRLTLLGPPVVFVSKPYSMLEVVKTVRRLTARG